jgi:hypothetical protein
MPVHKQIHIICFDDEFESPQKIRSLGPWHGSSEGEIECLKASSRALIEEQGFVIVYQHLVNFSAHCPATQSATT